MYHVICVVHPAHINVDSKLDIHRKDEWLTLALTSYRFYMNERMTDRVNEQLPAIDDTEHRHRTPYSLIW